MAATWVAQASVAFASAKSMLGILNGGGNVLRSYRYCIFNTHTVAVTAALSVCSVRRLTALSSGTTVTPVKHDTSSGALTSVTCVHGGTATGTDTFRRFLWLLEEATTTGVTQANWEVLIPVGIVFFPTGGDSNLEPIVSRNTYGTDIFNVGAGAVTTMEFEITFTDAAS
jgi:hypothetical protein